MVFLLFFDVFCIIQIPVNQRYIAIFIIFLYYQNLLENEADNFDKFP